MILATHGIAGALLAQVTGANPLAALVLGFGSHFALDALPHWDYQLASEVKNPAVPLHKEFTGGPAFRRDLLKIGLDCAGGALVVLGLILWFNFDPLAVAAGWVGALIPDALQFAYAKLRWRSLRWLQDFHETIHTSWRLSARPVLGLGLQFGLIFILWLIVV